MIKGAVFDLDHTLFDRYGTIRAVIGEFCSKFELGDGITLEKAADLMIEGDKKFNHRGWGETLKFLIEKGMFKNPPTLSEYSKALLDEFARVSVPYDFTKPMLDKLHAMGLKTGLITNGKSHTQRSKIENLGLEPYLDEIIVSGEFGVDKPSPEPYIEMAKRLGFKPEELIYVGDNPATDIMGARAGGYIPVWVATFGWWTIPEIEKTEYMVNDVSEIPDLICRINDSHKKNRAPF